jgi:membrane protein implicated in regulation of membrane protease activity
MEFLENAEFWHWWVLGIVLIVIETMAPGTFFLWMGVSAGIVGLVMLAAPEITWEFQFLVFAVAAVVTAVSWRLYQKRHPTKTDRPTLNRRGEQYVGRTFTLEEPVVNGQGKIHVDDSTWKIEGDDLPAGAKVHVTGVEGTVLKIDPA